MTLAELASLRHSGGLLGLECPKLATLQVEDILRSLHDSHTHQPLTNLKERRTHEREEALEVEYGVIDMGGVALSGIQQPTRQEATKSA